MTATTGSPTVDARRALDALRQEAAGCRACPLGEIGTQTVFGAGPATARLVLIGEAPGYQEDKEGVPFVGPSGRLLNEALEQAGLARDELYITNVVKHRPWLAPEGHRGGAVGRHGKNRAPKQSEINACRPWLSAEIESIRPAVIGCLGALAAKWVLGKDFKLTRQRGQWLSAPAAPHVLATLHPSYVLIQPETSYGATRDTLFADVRALAEKLRALR